jgi:hypothetical protein
MRLIAINGIGLMRPETASPIKLWPFGNRLQLPYIKDVEPFILLWWLDLQLCCMPIDRVGSLVLYQDALTQAGR